MVMVYSVACDREPDPIVTAPAMDKNRSICGVFQHRQNMGNLPVFGWQNTRKAEADVPHSRGLDPFSLSRLVNRPTPEIEHGFDSHVRQCFPVLFFGLPSPINVLIDTVEMFYLCSSSDAQRQQ